MTHTMMDKQSACRHNPDKYKNSPTGPVTSPWLYFPFTINCSEQLKKEMNVKAAISKERQKTAESVKRR